MKKLIWALAERADWYDWRPRRFWSWLLRRMDRAHGYRELSDVVTNITPPSTPLSDHIGGGR